MQNVVLNILSVVFSHFICRHKYTHTFSQLNAIFKSTLWVKSLLLLLFYRGERGNLERVRQAVWGTANEWWNLISKTVLSPEHVLLLSLLFYRGKTVIIIDVVSEDVRRNV